MCSKGCLPDRSLLSNVVDIDADAQEASLSSEAGGAVFFDFAAAFPSVSHAFLHDVLEHLGVPASFRRFVDVLYLGNGCRLALQGGLFPGFSLRSGIRQGCPLSPLLFALCGDILLRRLASRLPLDTIRAYADDVALVSRDILGSCRTFGPVFEEYARLSGMELNLRKTVFVPLSDVPLDRFRERLAELHPRWNAVACRYWAAYLGFVLGPEGRPRSWEKAFEKYEQRAALWASLGLGLHYTAAAYNTYVVSTLSFLVQLEPLPAQWEAVERAALRRLTPGPAHWIQPADLHALRQTFHFPVNFADLRTTSVAARFRVLHRTAEASGGLRVQPRLRRLRRAAAASDALVRQARWAEWFRQPMLALLDEAQQELERHGHTCESLEASLARGPRPLTRAAARVVRRGLQRAAGGVVAAYTYVAGEARLRRRLERWNLPLMPRFRATRALRICGRLRPLVPPRVQAAVIRTWHNGWCTRRRFQAAGGCLFGCSMGHDSVEHYSECRVLHDFGVQSLRLPPAPDLGERRLAFMLLAATPSLDDATLSRRALLLTAAYALHCRHRRAGQLGSAECCKAALRQAVHEAARGHVRATRTLTGLWARSPPVTSRPPSSRSRI